MRWTTSSPAHRPARVWIGGRHLVVSGAICFTLLATVATWLFLPKESPVSHAAQLPRGPRLAVDRDFIDFGPVPFGRIVRARFHVRNVGDQPLHLEGPPEVVAVEGC